MMRHRPMQRVTNNHRESRQFKGMMNLQLDASQYGGHSYALMGLGPTFDFSLDAPVKADVAVVGIVAVRGLLPIFGLLITTGCGPPS
ncbi:MAG TPA: hypothetical protein VM925_16130 [Labilithrix sp.]|nr:hypothetical protein [Labilithrix sp.]